MWDEFLQYTKLEVGNGARIRFWIDIQNENESLKNRFTDLFRCALNREGHIADFDLTSCWHVTFRRSLNDWELSSFCQFLQQLNTCQINLNREDGLVKVNSRDKIFSVNNCYKIVLHQHSQEVPNWRWKMIWKTKAPVKASCFGWLAARDACLSQNKLQRRGFPWCSRCYFCKNEEETVEHLFLHCSFLRQCWEVFLSIVGVSLVIHHKISRLLLVWKAQGMKRDLTLIWRTIPIYCILWTIWFERNKACFEGKIMQISGV